MGQPFVGEIRMFGGNFAPAGWMFCSGQLLPISEFETLFNLIGTTYGGDGQSTFQLPDLQGRVPIHQGQGGGLSNYIIGQAGGVESVTLSTQQIPQHTHVPGCSNGGGNQDIPGGGVWAVNASVSPYSTNAPGTAMAAQAVQQAGGSQPHENRMPLLVVSFIISMFGVFPSQS
jgi:microcystin-dependent protein